MFELISQFPLSFWLVTTGVALTAGVVKGAVGFGMPMIMIVGISSVASVEVALALLIVPTVATNLVQALRGGLQAAWRAMVSFRVFLIVGAVCLVSSAQLVAVLPTHILFLMIGVPVCLFAGLQLVGFEFQVAPERRQRFQFMAASVAGFIGGISGVWGPPTVAYLTAVNTEKEEQIRIQGVVYGLGAVLLFMAHLKSGVVNMGTFPLSILMLIPAGIGMGIGFWVQGRIDQKTFKKATLIVLIIAGLNLLRRGMLGG
ncbi:sulfite exporter TauE/SafE family protein [Cochlodiniinecator piscidefendens]|uniref:sulfite exporter TauE/SafE family protein n=1 Tax=Cochlodiniinecator piscidefendens TaxID=2715756 RepID=UPI00140B3FA0|nr:sulfite exporter TauE/SafE family protein [Cochlodiniinecator piscidefendens]